MPATPAKVAAGDPGDIRPKAVTGNSVTEIEPCMISKYQKASSVADAVAALKAADDGKVMAGGADSPPTMKQRLAAPSDVIDLAGISGINNISASGGVTIGAMATHASVAGSADVPKGAIPALAHLADGIGDPQVRNRGTIGARSPATTRRRTIPAACLGNSAPPSRPTG